VSTPPSAYDPIFARRHDPQTEAEAERVYEAFDHASRAYLSSAVPWLAWAVLLPAAALATPAVQTRLGEAGVLGLWSVVILAGGAVEGVVLLRARRRRRAGPLGAWAMRVQGNLSLVAVALSALLVWLGQAVYLPGLWLLLLGHSFFALGGLAFPPLRSAGVVFQLGGAAALVTTVLELRALPPLALFAAATGAGCLRVAWGLWCRAGDEGS
jgi:hypothetical protein